ncbi:MAG TPA: hemolysin family protein [Thermomicrobiales bacterium]|mgnify:CR=1 FL=1
MGNVTVELVLIAILLAINAFLAASEIALVSVRKVRLRALADDGNRAARRILALVESPGSFLATIQVGITLAGFFSAAVGAVSLVKLVGNWLSDAPVSVIANNAHGIALILVTALISFISIVLGELVPKTFAVTRAESIALRVVRPIEALAKIARPAVWLLTSTTNLILRIAGVSERARIPSVTQAEILAMVETAEDEGVVAEEEAELVEEALGFGQIVVRSVMVPRVDVVLVSADTPLREAIDIFFSTGFSRLPVYRGSQDTIIGILHVKDAFRFVWSDPNAASKPVSEAIRPAYFVPETKPIDELLAELRARRTHIAIVVDEYGGMAGIVTLEDLIEELVGEISDEFDPGYEPFNEIGPGLLEVDGRVSLLDLFDRLDLQREKLEPIEAESVGGLIADRLGRIPQEGDTVETGPLRLEVRAMDGYRVSRVRVEVNAAKLADEDEEFRDGEGER